VFFFILGGLQMQKTVLFLFLFLLYAKNSMAEVVMMSPTWAQQICASWNKSKTLTTELAGENWMDNNNKRGYKVIHLYRANCPKSPRVELTISAKNNKAICTYGGAIKHKKINFDVDYLMFASDKDWQCMGAKEFGCGPMGAMMSGKLKFSGPKMEAMGVMGPFEDFLVLAGSKKANKKVCPK
jgi:putative sterol carrier protein